MQETQEKWIRSVGQEDHLSKKWQSTPVFLPGKFYRQRSLVGYSPWSHKNVGHEWMTEHERMQCHWTSAISLSQTFFHCRCFWYNAINIEALLHVSFQFSSVQSLSRVQLSVTPWTAAQQASLSITNSWSLLKLMSIESVMPSSHLILCRPFLLSPSIFPSIRVFSNESALL